MRYHSDPRARACALLLSFLLASSAPSSAQQMPWTFLGDQAGANLGAVATVGDVDDDGTPDVLVGAPFAVVGGTAKGRAFLLSGADGTLLLTLSGNVTNERFGAAVLGPGDLDGDDVPDLVVGAPGNSALTGSVDAYAGADGALLWSVAGAQNGDGFGFALGWLPDQDSDGVPEILVGVPGDDGGGTNAGRVTLLSGADGQVLDSHEGEDAGDQLGIAISALAGTVQQDVEPVPVVGASQAGGSGTGYALVLDPEDFGIVERLDGDDPNDRFGERLDMLGDLDDDDVCDFAVTARQRNGSGQAVGPGYVRVFSGADRSLLFQLDGLVTGAGFGDEVIGIGDIDDDGVPDIAVGVPGADVNGTDSGTLRVFAGSDGALLHELHGPAADTGFGASLAALGDIDGDGLADLAVGAPLDDTGASNAGALFAVSFSPWETESNGVPGTHDVPLLVGRGSLQPETEVELVLSSALEDTTAELVIGTALYVDPVQGVVSPIPSDVEELTVDEHGGAEYTYTWPSGMPSGTRVYYQVRVPDAQGPQGEALSNTLSSTSP